ncbi:hypothetical protein TeGR_g4419 [Tetraparma gracilis]|uniref:Bromodomain-containing protein n=1 Tax=Tetraparma gracilis TaxID=2962635 RepID=A0ABQ6MKS9_9STRA|nr:hypothetical protein TeGR_g4419 [Tetraparma gracilis]
MARDIRRVFTNAMLYNHAGSDFHLLAASFLSRFDASYAAVLRACGEESAADKLTDPADPERSGLPSLAAKSRMTSRIFSLAPGTLGSLLELLDRDVPRALKAVVREGGGEPAVEFDLDVLGPEEWGRLEEFMEKQEGEGRKRKR